MLSRFPRWTITAAGLFLALATVVGQAPSTGSRYRAPRTGDGKPNLNGIWQALNTANWDIEAHAAAPHTKDWRGKIDQMRLSDYDQRPYKTLSLGGQPATNDDATYVISHVDIGGQGTNAAQLLRGLAETSRKENGNLRFDVLQHAARANHFTVIEAWRNQRALDAHAAAAHTRQYRDSLNPITGSPLDERIYKVAD